MSKLLINLALLQTKALVNAYTWTTLPFYTLAQRPWQRIRMNKSFGVRKSTDKHGRTIYSRPSPANSHPYFKNQTFPELLPLLRRDKPAVGVRDILSEKVALDENGNELKVDGKVLKKLELSKEYRWLSVGEVLDRVDSIAKGLRELGIVKGDKVLIYAENGPDWLYTCLALARLNAVTVTLFSTLSDSGVVHGANQCDAQYMITSENLLGKLNSLSSQFHSLNTLVYIPTSSIDSKTSIQELSSKKFRVQNFCEIESIGQKLPKTEFLLPSPQDIAVIMYTSGTTGNPKGVTITHGQLYAGLMNLIHIDEENDYLCFKAESFASYLPMAHIFGYMMNLIMFCSDSKIAFCNPLTLLNSSPSHPPGQKGDLSLIKPEYMIAVPLMLERILKEIYRKLNEQSPIAAPIFTYLMDYKIRWTARGYDTPIINRLVCKNISDQFGGKLKYMNVAGAPLHERTQALVKAALNVQVCQVYGATEMASGSHCQDINDLSVGTCGIPEHSFRCYLEDWTEGGYSTSDKPNPRGELIVGGATISEGYYKLPDETNKSYMVDEDGTRWYKSGDIGEILPNGSIKIVDRKSDLTKLANGEFISLGKIESGLRNSKYVENICICTDPHRNHVTALISPNRRSLTELGKSLSPKSNYSIEQLCTEPDVIKRVQNSINQLGKELSFAPDKEIPVKITLTKEEWTQENNLLTAAFKMRRKQVNQFYQEEIKKMFA